LNFEVTNAAKRAAAKGLVARSKASRWHRYYQLGSDAVESKEGTFAALIQELMRRLAPRHASGAAAETPQVM
jgi:hypothetical protein